MSRPIAAALAAAALVLAFASAKNLQQDALATRLSWPRVEENIVLPPPEAAPIVYAWLGRQLAADINWSRALVYYGSSTIGESDFRYLERFIDTVIELDPKFHRVYDWAADAVAWKAERATVKEFRTSVRYLERAVDEFPGDWDLRRRLALRYALDLNPETEEERNRYRERAAELLEEAAQIPGSRVSTATLAATLRTKIGQRNRALASLEQVIAATDDKEARDKLLARYRHIAEDDEVAAEMAAWRRDFDRRWRQSAPYASPDFFALLGPEPPRRVDLESVAPIPDSALSLLYQADADAEAKAAAEAEAKVDAEAGAKE